MTGLGDLKTVFCTDRFYGKLNKNLSGGELNRFTTGGNLPESLIF